MSINNFFAINPLGGCLYSSLKRFEKYIGLEKPSLYCYFGDVALNGRKMLINLYYRI